MSHAATMGYLNATELADYLVAKGIPFRTAHEITGRTVRYAIGASKKLEELSLDELRQFSELIDVDALKVLPLRRCVDRRISYGGTAPEAVRLQIKNAESDLRKQRDAIEKEKQRLQKLFDDLTG
jgi:argininosuccinate lyase